MTAKEKLYNFVKKNYEREKEKYQDGYKNNFGEWEDVLSELESPTERVSKFYADGLEEEIKRLKKLLDVYHINY